MKIMGARPAALTFKKLFAFELILPCHYGTFPDMLDPTGDKLVAEMTRHNVVVPKVGQAIDHDMSARIVATFEAKASAQGDVECPMRASRRRKASHPSMPPAW